MERYKVDVRANILTKKLKKNFADDLPVEVVRKSTLRAQEQSANIDPAEEEVKILQSRFEASNDKIHEENTNQYHKTAHKLNEWLLFYKKKPIVILEKTQH